MPAQTLSRIFILAALGLTALLSSAAPAAAESCTLGVDTPRFADRPPSACSYLTSPALPTGQVTTGPDGSPWFIVADRAGFHILRRVGFTVSMGPALPMPEQPTGLITGPDSAVWVVAGGTIVRVASTGVNAFPLPTRAASYPAGGTRLTGIVSVGGRMWLPGQGGIIEVDPSGATAFHPTPGLTPVGGIDVLPDASLIFSAGSRIGRLFPNGQVTSFPVSPPADTDVSHGPTDSPYTIYWGSRAPRALNRMTTTGATESWSVYAAPTDLLPVGRYAMWAGLSEGTRHYVVRLQTQSFPRGRPPGVPCYTVSPISCGFGMRATLVGERPQLFIYGALANIALGANDQNLHFAAGSRLGRVIPFRGLLPCARLGAVIGRFRASACRPGFWDGFVTARPVAYLRISCLRLTYHFCGGSASLFYQGRFIGRSIYVVQAYDNPQIRFPMTRATYNLIKARGSIVAIAAVRTFDRSGLVRVHRYPVRLYPGARDRTP